MLSVVNVFWHIYCPFFSVVNCASAVQNVVQENSGRRTTLCRCYCVYFAAVVHWHVFYIFKKNFWLGGVVVTALDSRLEIAGWIVTSPSQPNLNAVEYYQASHSRAKSWYHYKLGGRGGKAAHRTTHWPVAPISRSCSVGDQRRPMVKVAGKGRLLFTWLWSAALLLCKVKLYI